MAEGDNAGMGDEATNKQLSENMKDEANNAFKSKFC
jgi:hypothetical protein